jgi:hypothetical protein
MTSLGKYTTPSLGKELEKLIFNENYQTIILKMNNTKYVTGKEPNESVAIINKFVSIY